MIDRNPARVRRFGDHGRSIVVTAVRERALPDSPCEPLAAATTMSAGRPARPTLPPAFGADEKSPTPGR
ncbi:hypothetical protein [Streptomyces avermitilis]|uniref:hypothetical protein n=1 Tax=Streptomyces avermitilis TaxID=33903 RepID=UPI0036B78E62